MPSAAAPISSLCSAMRFLSRQVSWRIGSTPAADQKGRRGERAHMGARAGAVGDIDRIGHALERLGLAQQVAGIARDRRRKLCGHDESALAQSVLENTGKGGALLCWFIAQSAYMVCGGTSIRAD